MQENMQEKISSRKIIIMICAAVVVIAAAVIMLIFNREEAYRSIMVYELQGSAVIERADIGAIDAVENLYLESGDRVRVEDESMMRMKLDNDKYITAEANTIFALEAEGNEQDSKTRISLEQGAITNEIQHPLSGGSLYETSTPNSVMAVRGTIYRAELYDDGNGGQNMRLCCFEGTVAVMPIFPDGSMGEEILVHAGSELTVYSDGTTDAVKDIDYDSLPEQAIRILGGQKGAAADAEESEPSEIAEDEDTEEAAAESAVEEESERDENDSQEDDMKSNDAQTAKNTGNNRTAGKEESKQTPQKPKEGTTTPKNPTDGSNSGNSDSGNSDSGDTGDQNTVDEPGDDSGNEPSKPDKVVTYMVTFRYQGTVFATQSVKKGGKASAPVLAPASSGAWDFDFNTKINANTTIEWKQ